MRVRVSESKGATRVRHEDRLATEEPLEIRIAEPGAPPYRANVTMRTPGHDFELAAGWLRHEGVIDSLEDLVSVAYCTDTDLAPEQEFNVVTVRLAAAPRRRIEGRVSGSSSACGVCGSDSIEAALATRGSASPATLTLDVLRGVPETLRGAQTLFARTGAVHGAAALTPRGALLEVREDVGRHNAVDKLTGSRLLAGEPTRGLILGVSGRVGFEIVQKAAAASYAAIVAVGAPTSLAARLAAETGLVLVGWASPERAVLYTGAEWVT